MPPSVKMATHSFIRYAVGSNQRPATVYLHCHVKPGVSKVREGIASLTDDAIELCVSAVARDGESNKAVLAVLSQVRNQILSVYLIFLWRCKGACGDGGDGGLILINIGQALDVPKSDLQITRGAKSRDKVIALGGRAVQDGEAECLGRLLKRLGEAAGESNNGG